MSSDTLHTLALALHQDALQHDVDEAVRRIAARVAEFTAAQVVAFRATWEEAERKACARVCDEVAADARAARKTASKRGNHEDMAIHGAAAGAADACAEKIRDRGDE